MIEVGVGVGLERAARYLERVANSNDATPSSLPLRLHLQAVFGLWVAERAEVVDAASACGVAAHALRDSIETNARHCVFNCHDHDSKLLLVCHYAMRSHGAESGQLAHYTEELAATFRSVDEAPAEFAGDIFLLELLGKETGHASISRSPFEANLGLLRADVSHLRRATTVLAGLSGFGTRHVTLKEPSAARDALSFILLEKLREYDLILGSALLRALTHLGAADCEEVGYAVEYLLSQQHADGRFGYYARELGRSQPLAHGDVDIYLPVTVALAWALADTRVPSFRLVPAQARPRDGCRD